MLERDKDTERECGRSMRRTLGAVGCGASWEASSEFVGGAVLGYKLEEREKEGAWWGFKDVVESGCEATA